MRNAVSLKPKPCRQRLGHEPDHRVDLLEVVVVDALHLVGPLGDVGDLLEAPRRRLVQQAAEAVVARHAALAVAEDVDGAEVELLAVVLDQVLQELRVVVQPDGARMMDAERVEQIGDVEAGEELDAAAAGQLGKLGVGETRPGRRRADREVIRHQRVHPVDRDELLGQRERHAVMIGRRAGDPGEQIVVGELRKRVLQPAEPAVPVGAQAGGGDLVRQDRGRPFHRVDLRQQRRVDQPGLLEQPLVVPVRVVFLQLVADRVVLEREQRVQQAQADPAVLGEAGDLAAGERIDAKPSARAHEHLAIAAGTERRLCRGAAAVDVRPVPPVRVLVDVDRRPGRSRDLGRVRGRDRHAHRPFVPAVAAVERDVVGMRPGALPVHEPVVDHELNPRRGDDVEDGGGLERLARQQLEADPARARVHQVGGIGEGIAQRHVAPEAHPGAAHARTREIVVGAVARPYRVRVGSGGRRGVLERRLFSVVQVLLAQLVAKLDQLDAGGGPGKREPVVEPFAHDVLLRSDMERARGGRERATLPPGSGRCQCD